MVFYCWQSVIYYIFYIQPDSSKHLQSLTNIVEHLPPPTKRGEKLSELVDITRANICNLHFVK